MTVLGHWSLSRYWNIALSVHVPFDPRKVSFFEKLALKIITAVMSKAYLRAEKGVLLGALKVFGYLAKNGVWIGLSRNFSRQSIFHGRE